MKIRTTTPADFDRIQQIYAYAREQMRKNGNPNQWGNSRPTISVLLEDIHSGKSYLIEESGRICGVFAFSIGADPTYRVIEQGAWLNEAPYGVIHRLAGSEESKGIFSACLSYCLSQIPNLRIDTHQDNLIMQHLLEKNGFRKCGIIYVDDGSPRLAYQKSPQVCLPDFHE